MKPVITVVLLLWGCTHTPPQEYFTPPPQGDPWKPKVQGWQQREVLSEVASPSPLRTEVEEFEVRTRRKLARRTISWVQAQSLEYYREDSLWDHWATLEETLGNNGDDCDGLELITLSLLRSWGFEGVYRGLVRERKTDLYHMVTLWFEDPQNPWVLDPTGAATRKMALAGELREWEVVRIFSEEEYFGAKLKRPE